MSESMENDKNDMMDESTIEELRREKASILALVDSNLSPLQVPNLDQNENVTIDEEEVNVVVVDEVTNEDVDVVVVDEDEDSVTRDAIFKSLEQSISANNEGEAASAMLDMNRSESKEGEEDEEDDIITLETTKNSLVDESQDNNDTVSNLLSAENENFQTSPAAAALTKPLLKYPHSNTPTTKITNNPDGKSRVVYTEKVDKDTFFTTPTTKTTNNPDGKSRVVYTDKVSDEPLSTIPRTKTTNNPDGKSRVVYTEKVSEESLSTTPSTKTTNNPDGKSRVVFTETVGEEKGSTTPSTKTTNNPDGKSRVVYTETVGEEKGSTTLSTKTTNNPDGKNKVVFTETVGEEKGSKTTNNPDGKNKVEFIEKGGEKEGSTTPSTKTKTNNADGKNKVICTEKIGKEKGSTTPGTNTNNTDGKNKVTYLELPPIQTVEPAKDPVKEPAPSVNKPVSPKKKPAAKKQSPKKGSGEKKVLVPIADGSEDIETVCVTDTLSRFGAKVVTASVHYKRRNVKLSRGLEIVTDTTMEELTDNDWDCIVLPGGMQGALNLQQCQLLILLLKRQHQMKKLIGAICAAPATILVKAGIVPSGATCYPADNLLNKIPNRSVQDVVVTDHIVTSAGPGTAIDFALKLGSILYNERKAKALATRMIVLNFDSKKGNTPSKQPTKRKTQDASIQTVKSQTNYHYDQQYSSTKRPKYDSYMPPAPRLLTIADPAGAIRAAVEESPPINEDDLSATSNIRMKRNQSSARKSLKPPSKTTAVKAKPAKAKADKPSRPSRKKESPAKRQNSDSESEFQLDSEVDDDESYTEITTPTTRRRSPHRLAKSPNKRKSSTTKAPPKTSRPSRSKSPKTSPTRAKSTATKSKQTSSSPKRNNTTPRAKRSLSSARKKSTSPVVQKSPKSGRGYNSILFHTVTWPKMEKLGFVLETGSRPNDKTIFPPGVTRQNGKNRVDFFDSVKGIMEYLKSNKKWSKVVQFHTMCELTLESKSNELRRISDTSKRMEFVENEVLKSNPNLKF